MSAPSSENSGQRPPPRSTISLIYSRFSPRTRELLRNPFAIFPPDLRRFLRSPFGYVLTGVYVCGVSFTLSNAYFRDRVKDKHWEDVKERIIRDRVRMALEQDDREEAERRAAAAAAGSRSL